MARITGERAHRARARARFSISYPTYRGCQSRFRSRVSVALVENIKGVKHSSCIANCITVDACTKGRASSRYDSLFKTLPPSVVEATTDFSAVRESQSSLVRANYNLTREGTISFSRKHRMKCKRRINSATLISFPRAQNTPTFSQGEGVIIIRAESQPRVARFLLIRRTFPRQIMKLILSRDKINVKLCISPFLVPGKSPHFRIIKSRSSDKLPAENTRNSLSRAR